jgi:hypothetical protein
MYSGKLLMMGRGTAPKHAEFLDRNKFGKMIASVGYIKKEICYDARSHEHKKKSYTALDLSKYDVSGECVCYR